MKADNTTLRRTLRPVAKVIILRAGGQLTVVNKGAKLLLWEHRDPLAHNQGDGKGARLLQRPPQVLFRDGPKGRNLRRQAALGRMMTHARTGIIAFHSLATGTRQRSHRQIQSGSFRFCSPE